MKIDIDEFEKSKEFLVCVDSDGCAMDTMEVKHRKCFGPKIVEVWGLQAIEEKFLETWNMINLYSKTRGINRFKGLVKIFEVLTEEGIKMPEFNSIKKWTETTEELSNPALERAIKETKDEQLTKALEWSNAVNDAISKLHNEDKPFPYVKECLEMAQNKADIVIVSSANGRAVMEEWTRHGLALSVNLMLGQEAGTKAICIAKLKEKNFSDDKILMVGDAPSDLEAALKNRILFYPILVGREKFSWKRLATEALPRLIDGSYKGEYQEKLINEFNSSLK